MSLLVVLLARWSIRLSVAHWGVDAATLGPSDDGRLLLHVGKQERGDDDEAGIFQDMDDACAERHGRVPVRRNGEVFSSRPFMVSRSRCLYSVATGYP